MYISLFLFFFLSLSLSLHAHNFKIFLLTKTHSWGGWHLVDMPELVQHFVETHMHLRGAKQKLTYNKHNGVHSLGKKGMPEFLHTYIYIYVCIYVCMHACMYACMYVWMYVCIILYVWMYLCICMHACIHVCICMCFVFCYDLQGDRCIGYWSHWHTHTHAHTHTHLVFTTATGSRLSSSSPALHANSHPYTLYKSLPVGIKA